MAILTGLIPNVYKALDIVSRELVGVIPGVQRDATADRVATNASLIIGRTGKSTNGDFTPAMSLPAEISKTVSPVSLSITKNRFNGFSFTGEEQYGLNQGQGFSSVKMDEVTQCIRELVNEMEADVANALGTGASRAFGTAGTAPFGANVGDSAQVRKILDDNGAPLAGRSLVVNTSAGANLRTLQQLTRANEAGSNMTLRDGELLNLNGFTIRESAQIATPTAGTGTGYLVNSASLVKGSTTIPADTGSGTILAGDIVTIGGNNYVVATALSGGSFTITAPGLVGAVADNTAITRLNAGARNIAYTQDALLLATRIPNMPMEGALAIDSQIITDPRTGISFDLRAYAGVGMITYRMHVAWGWVVKKPEHAAILLG